MALLKGLFPFTPQLSSCCVAAAPRLARPRLSLFLSQPFAKKQIRWQAPFSTGSRWHSDEETRSQELLQQRRKKQDEVAAVYESLPSTQQQSRLQLTKRFSNFMDKAQTSIFFAGQRINDLTGYSGIEALKSEISNLERFTLTTRESLSEAKAVYSAAIARRSSSQREINDLLQRQSSWTPQDLERFTTLYRSDHANQQAELTAESTLMEAERVAEEAQDKLSKTILARYHEEQIWSDKIRRVSTWGTWGLMGLNLVLFLVFQIGVEPWRRARLVRGFDEKVKEALQEFKPPKIEAGALATATHFPAADATTAITAATAEGEDTLSSPVEEGYIDTSELSFLESINYTLDVLFAETPITISHYELTTSILSGFFMGTMLTTALALLFIMGMEPEM